MPRNTKVQNNRSGWSSRTVAEATFMFDVLEQQRLHEERLRAEKAARRAAAKATSPVVTEPPMAAVGYLRVWRDVANGEAASFASRLMALALQFEHSQQVAWPSVSVFDNKQPRMRHVIDPDFLKQGKKRLKRDLAAAVPSIAEPLTVAVTGLGVYGSQYHPFLALDVESVALKDEVIAVKNGLPIARTIHHKEAHLPHVSIIKPVTFEIAQAMTQLTIDLPEEISFNAARLMVEPQALITAPGT